MTYLEKIIDGLELAKMVIEQWVPMFEQYNTPSVIDYAIDLLKAQQPRVMTLEEARDVEVVWAEDRATNEVFLCPVKNNMNDSELYKYGIQWRVWNARPTDEQRRAIPWE